MWANQSLYPVSLMSYYLLTLLTVTVALNKINIIPIILWESLNSTKVHVNLKSRLAVLVLWSCGSF